MRRPPPSRLAEIVDTGFEGFSAGQGDEGLHLWRTRSELTLAPSVVGEFDGPEAPPGWSVETTTDGGSTTFVGGAVALDGAGIFADALVANGRAIEFEATFARRPNQHAGLGVDFVKNPWVSFSTKFGNALYARTNFYLSEDQRVSAEVLGSRHRYRIDWNVIDIVFSVDGGRAAHLLVPVPGFMRVGAASTSRGGGPLLVAWMLVTPYRSTGRFLSRVLDAGGRSRWKGASWDADAPPATEVHVGIRTGDTPEPDPSWAPWLALDGVDGVDGAEIDEAGRYAQYRVELRTADPRQTPALRRVSLRHTPAEDDPGPLTSRPG